VAVDGSRRNELFSMLYEQVNAILKQAKVGKETIFQMKSLIKKKERKIHDLYNDLNAMAD
jgi:peptidoglycan hydrolase CwlO-like protein